MFAETAAPYQEKPDGTLQPLPPSCADSSGGSAPVDCAIEALWTFCDQTTFTQAQTTQPPWLAGGKPATNAEATSGYVCTESCPASTPWSGAVCAANNNGKTYPPAGGNPPAFVANGPSRPWASPWLASGAVLPNQGSFYGQASTNYCGLVHYGGRTCSY